MSSRRSLLIPLFAFPWILFVFDQGLAGPLCNPSYSLRPEVKPCSLPLDDLGLRKEDEADWSVCEKWIWSCIRNGKEANLFAKECTEPRPDAYAVNYRNPYICAPFVDPGRYANTNGISGEFIRTLLWRAEYHERIPPSGIRIFGAYFKDPVNLENVTTATNLVLDGSMFKRGVRLTNFQSKKNVSFDGSNLRGKLLLMRARIDGSLFMERGVYDFVDLRDARIGASLEASRSVFNDILRFDRAHIEGKVFLVKSRLTALNAWDAKIGGSIELRRADIRLRTDLTGSTVNGDLRLQQVTFGRRVGQVPSCDWDPESEIDHILHETYMRARQEDPQLREMVLDEIVRTRPTVAGTPAESICDEANKDEKRTAKHEVLLRDMKINGTLCVMDITGAIPVLADGRPDSPHSGGAAVERISLDGTQANATVLRWINSDSPTLWRAVNFKSRYMLMGLDEQPARYFIDNVDIGFVAFMHRIDVNLPEVRDDDDDKYLCDITPKSTNVDPANSRDTQDRLIAFFTKRANESGSAQPFANIVARLEASGVNTTYLKRSLSEYKLRDFCTTSLFSKTWRERQELSSPNKARGWREPWNEMVADWREVTSIPGVSSIDEARKLALDWVCAASLPVVKYTVAYGHEPHNLLFWVAGFIGFFWVLLKFDKPPKLGLMYAVDTFIPVSQLRFHQDSLATLPKRRSLQRYLIFVHRPAGFVLCLAVFVLVFKAV